MLLAVLMPPLGMFYCNKGKRALWYLLAQVLAVSLAGLAVLFGWPYSASLFPLVLIVYVYGIADTYRIAKENRIALPLKWFSRWYGLAAICGILVLGLLVRTIYLESFRIASGSMMPTLVVGDLIFVNKSAYRAGVLNSKPGAKPVRGDVIVFRYPPNPSQAYVFRVVGVPGERVIYANKRLSINGSDAPLTPVGDFRYRESRLNFVTAKQLRETLGTRTYGILQKPDFPPVHLSGVQNFPLRSNCSHSEDGFSCLVPEGRYLTLGDNRDSSNDGRYWGFIPEGHIIGKATMIYGSEGRGFDRLGKRIE